MPHDVKIPFAKVKVQVVLDFDQFPGITAMADWGPNLKREIEEACFNHFRNKVASIGPETLPIIRRPADVWKHLEFQHVRIDPAVSEAVVIYVIPAWDQDNHMEWCVRDNRLVYAGEFLGVPVERYSNLGRK